MSTANPVDPFALASRWCSDDEWRRLVYNEDAEPLPTHLNPAETTRTNISGYHHLIDNNKLSVRRLLGSPEPSTVLANYPAPTKQLAYYFEMTVKNAGKSGRTTIGFNSSDESYPYHSPGSDKDSCGYRGDDGFLYLGDMGRKPFGPTFTTGDTVGSGINYASQEFFFTKNGEVVGIVPKHMKGPVYPTISVYSVDEEVIVNFGNKEFVFDIKAFILCEQGKQQAKFEELELQQNISHQCAIIYFFFPSWIFP